MKKERVLNADTWHPCRFGFGEQPAFRHPTYCNDACQIVRFRPVARGVGIPCPPMIRGADGGAGVGSGLRSTGSGGLQPPIFGKCLGQGISLLPHTGHKDFGCSHSLIRQFPNPPSLSGIEPPAGIVNAPHYNILRIF